MPLFKGDALSGVKFSYTILHDGFFVKARVLLVEALIDFPDQSKQLLHLPRPIQISLCSKRTLI